MLSNDKIRRSLKLLYNQKNKVYSNFSGFDLIGLDKRKVTLSYTFPMYNLYDDTEKEAILSSLSWFQKGGGNRGTGSVVAIITDDLGNKIYSAASCQDEDFNVYANLLTLGNINKDAKSLTLTINGDYDGTEGYAGGWCKCNNIKATYIYSED